MDKSTLFFNDGSMQKQTLLKSRKESQEQTTGKDARASQTIGRFAKATRIETSGVA